MILFACIQSCRYDPAFRESLIQVIQSYPLSHPAAVHALKLILILNTLIVTVLIVWDYW